MVRFPFSDPDSRCFEKLQADHQEDNQNYHYQEKFMTRTDRSTAKKENDQNNVVESQEQNVSLCSVCKTSDKIITDPESGEIICSNCGMVINFRQNSTNKQTGVAFI
jgi:hypothetical protein